LYCSVVCPIPACPVGRPAASALFYTPPDMGGKVYRWGEGDAGEKIKTTGLTAFGKANASLQTKHNPSSFYYLSNTTYNGAGQGKKSV